MSQEIRYNLTTRVATDGVINQELTRIIDGQIETLSRWLVNTQDAGIRNALCQLGWTPPAADEQRTEDRMTSQLLHDLKTIAEESMLPDGDGVTVPVALWAQEWINRLKAEPSALISKAAESVADELASCEQRPKWSEIVRAVKSRLESFKLTLECARRPKVEVACWYCGVILEPQPRPRCEACPDECDVEDCDALGCRP